MKIPQVYQLQKYQKFDRHYDKVEYSLIELRTIHRLFSVDNDRAIEALHEAVKRQKELGHAMNNEIDRHTEIIDTITHETGLLEGRVKRQTVLTKLVERKSSALWLWVIIILLFIAIVVLASVPIH